jgi:hypothetical protein
LGRGSGHMGACVGGTAGRAWVGWRPQFRSGAFAAQRSAPARPPRTKPMHPSYSNKIKTRAECACACVGACLPCPRAGADPPPPNPPTPHKQHQCVQSPTPPQPHTQTCHDLLRTRRPTAAVVRAMRLHVTLTPVLPLGERNQPVLWNPGTPADRCPRWTARLCHYQRWASPAPHLRQVFSAWGERAGRAGACHDQQGNEGGTAVGAILGSVHFPGLGAHMRARQQVRARPRDAQ